MWDIIVALEIEHLEMDETVFLGNEMVQDAVIRNLEIIGEASHSIEIHFPEFAGENSGLKIKDHPFFGMDSQAEKTVLEQLDDIRKPRHDL